MPKPKASSTARMVGGGGVSKMDSEIASPSLLQSATKYLFIVVVCHGSQVIMITKTVRAIVASICSGDILIYYSGPHIAAHIQTQKIAKGSISILDYYKGY